MTFLLTRTLFKYLTAFQPCDATKFSNQSALSLRTATWTVFLWRFSSGQFPFSLAERLAEINLRVPELIHGRFATGTLTGTTLATDEFTLSHQPSQAASMSTSTGLLAGTACSSKAKRCCVAGSFPIMSLLLHYYFVLMSPLFPYYVHVFPL